MKKQNVRTLSFIVSTFTYLLVGAAIFDALESQTEEQLRVKLENNETRYKTSYNISEDEYDELVGIVNKYHPYKAFPQWKFTGAFYFSLTVITTIGYGHSTPQTIPGKLFCMLYAIIGIPLCLVMFQAVGERLNYFASFCIQFIKKTIHLKNTEVNQTELVCVGGALAILVITGGAAIFTHYEGWSYFNSIYYCVVTLTTIGFGDFVALQGEKGSSSNIGNTGYVILSLTFILFGLTVVASSMNLLVLKFLTMNTDDERREEFTKEAQRNQSLRFSSADLLNVVNGNVICSFEPADLEDLRSENSFCCNTNTRIKWPFSDWIRQRLFSSRTANAHHYQPDNTADDRRNKICCCFPLSLSSSSSNYQITTHSSANGGDGGEATTVVYKCMKKKKKHYTIRRAPGMISHLLPLQRLDSIVAHTKLKDNNIKLKSKVLLKQTSVLNSDHDAATTIVEKPVQQNLDIVDYIDQENNSNTDFDTTTMNNQAMNTSNTIITAKNNKTSSHDNDDDDQSSLKDADNMDSTTEQQLKAATINIVYI